MRLLVVLIRLFIRLFIQYPRFMALLIAAGFAFVAVGSAVVLLHPEHPAERTCSEEQQHPGADPYVRLQHCALQPLGSLELSAGSQSSPDEVLLAVVPKGAPANAAPMALLFSRDPKLLDFSAALGELEKDPSKAQATFAQYRDLLAQLSDATVEGRRAMLTGTERKMVGEVHPPPLSGALVLRPEDPPEAGSLLTPIVCACFSFGLSFIVWATSRKKVVAARPDGVPAPAAPPTAQLIDEPPQSSNRRAS